jgi:hypothetical protein
MSATEFFLFPLAFLVSGLLAGWIWHLSRQRNGQAGSAPPQARDGDFARIGELLASAVGRIEVLERRQEELVCELHSRTGTPSAQPGSSAGAVTRVPSRPDRTVWDRRDASERPRVSEAGERPQPGRGAQAPEPCSESEVSPSQWRSAMDRLGPVWRSGSRLTDPGRRTSPADCGDAADRRDLELASSSRRGTPLDSLFPPPALFGELPRLQENDCDCTDREPELGDGTDRGVRGLREDRGGLGGKFSRYYSRTS